MYNKSKAAYFGDKDERMGVEGMDNTGRTVLRIQMLRQALTARSGAPNLLMPIVDDFVGTKGPLPSMKVVPWDDTDDAREKAAKFGRVLRSQWKNSKMDMQSYKMAWYLSCLGDVLLTLNPLFPKQAGPLRVPGVYINVVDPTNSYPSFKTGWESEDLSDVIIWERFTRDQAYQEWGIQSQENHVDALWYVGQDYNYLTVDQHEVASIQHDLGFCPAEWIKNKVNGRPSQSDIINAVEAHEEMQVMIAVMNDSLLETTYGQLVIKNPVNVQDDFEVGPGAEPIVVQGDGDVTRLAPAPPPQSANMLMENMWTIIQRIAGSAPVRTENAIPGSNISGRSVHAQQAPMETRLAGWQTIVGYHFENLNSKMLHMFYALPEFKDHVIDVWGTEKGKPFKIQFQGAELDGWTRNQVQWSAIIGSNAHERAVVGLSLKDKGLVPGTWVLDQIGIEDSDMLHQQARREHVEEMSTEAQAQQGAQAPAGGAPAAAPGGDGGQQAQPPAGMPPFPQVSSSPTQPGLGTPSPVPDLYGMLQQVLQQVGDQVAGEITAAYPTGPGNGVHIDIKEKDAASKNGDRQMLRQALMAAGFDRVTFGRGE